MAKRTIKKIGTDIRQGMVIDDLTTPVSKTDNAPSIRAILDLVYPVGSIYMSVNNISPATFLGGTWEVWGSGKTPVGVNASDTEFDTVEKSGGSKTMTISSSNLPTHTHTYDKSGANTGQNNGNTGAASGNTGAASGNTGSTTLTLSQIPSHEHDINGFNVGVTISYSGSGEKVLNVENWSYRNNTKNSFGTGANIFAVKQGGGQGHTHTLNSHTHTLNSHTHTLNNHSHTISTTSTNSGNGGFSNTATNNLQPYITCYMWKRTA